MKKVLFSISLMVLSSCHLTAQQIEESKQQTECNNIADTYEIAKKRNSSLKTIYKDMLNIISNGSLEVGILTKDQYSKELKENIKISGKKNEHYKIYRITKNCLKKINPEAQEEHYKNLREFVELIYGTYALEEKAKFLKRAGTKKLCIENSIDTYLSNQVLNFSPSKECLYSINEPGLKVQQSTRNGLLISSMFSYYNPLNFAILYKNNSIDLNAVDGSQVQPGYFKYKGIYSYQSLTGERSIYSFERVDINYLFKDILFFNRN